MTDGTTKRNLNVSELREALKAYGVDFRGRKDDLVRRCQMHKPAIPIEVETVKIAKEGWYGKPKGVFQILWERGYIDMAQKDKYLNHLIRNCLDFVNEKTMLQHIGEDMLGVIVDRTPKCTPEIAGEGIEYSWAMAKGWYRLQPLAKKKQKVNFHNLVKECVGPKILTVPRIRMFSRRAREYMVAYHLLENSGEDATPVNLSYLKKVRKSHTDVADIGFAWISNVMKEIVASMKSNKK